MDGRGALSQSQEMQSVKQLLNMLFLTLNDQYTENDKLEGRLKELSGTISLDYQKEILDYIQRKSERLKLIEEKSNSVKPGNVNVIEEEDGELKVDYSKELMSDLTDEDIEIIELRRQNAELVSQLQREDYMTKNYENVIERHQDLLRTLQDNIVAKKHFDADYSIIYSKLLNERSSYFDTNLEVLNHELNSVENGYRNLLNSIRQDLEKFSEGI